MSSRPLPSSDSAPVGLATRSARLRIWRGCRDAFLAITAPLKRGRAELPTKDLLNHIAADVDGKTGRYQNTFAFILAFRDAMSAAQRQGPDAFLETKAKVRKCFEKFEALTFEGFETTDAPPHPCVVADLTREISEALVATTRAVAEPTPMNHAKAEDEVADVVMAASSYVELAARDVWLVRR